MPYRDILWGYEDQEVILLGETHTESTHLELEEEAAYRTIPRYILTEGLDNLDPVDAEDYLNIDLLSLNDVARYFSRVYEDDSFLTRDLRSLHDEVEELDISETPGGIDLGRIPESYGEFIHMPFFRMHIDIADFVGEEIREKYREEVDEYVKWLDEDEFEDFDRKIDDLRDISIELREQSYKEEESLGSVIRPVQLLRVEGFEIGLAGCDIDKKDRYTEETGTEPEMAAVFEKLQEVGDEKELEQRDEFMADRIVEFNQKNDTERPVMAVIGSSHLPGVADHVEERGISVYVENLNEIHPPEEDLGDFLYPFLLAKEFFE